MGNDIIEIKVHNPNYTGGMPAYQATSDAGKTELEGRVASGEVEKIRIVDPNSFELRLVDVYVAKDAHHFAMYKSATARGDLIAKASVGNPLFRPQTLAGPKPVVPQAK